MTNLYMPVIAFVLSLIMVIVYFSKKRVDLLENKLYSLMLLSILFDSLCVSLIFINVNTVYNETIVKILNKIDFLFLIIWSTSILIYTYIVTYKEKKNFSENLKIFVIVNLILDLFMYVIVLFAPIDIILINDIKQTARGLAVNISIVFCLLHVVASLVMILLNFKNITQKHLPVFIINFTAVIIAILFSTNPFLICISIGLVLNNLIMYFTIENPDLKIIEELKRNRSLTSKSYIEKTNFLFRMSAEVRKPIENIKELNDYNIESNDIKEIKENSKEIDLNIRNANFTINNVLDVSSLDTKNINIVKNKYNIKKLLNEIYLREKKKINNIRFDFNIGELPEYLYGDSIRLKQVLICILDNLIENTKEGFIEVNVNSINKYDVCRLIITIENSGIPLSLEEINNILDNEKEIDENISLEDINKLINMMNGSLNIKSEEGNEFTISIDSIIVEPKKEEITNETDILFISNNERILKGLEYAFKEYTTNSVMSGIDAIDLIKSGENYNLIIIDDEMKPISGLETLKRLRKENINIPAIIMLDEGKEHIKNHYIKDGFIDYILKSDIKNEINRIIKKML